MLSRLLGVAGVPLLLTSSPAWPASDRSHCRTKSHVRCERLHTDYACAPIIPRPQDFTHEASLHPQIPLARDAVPSLNLRGSVLRRIR